MVARASDVETIPSGAHGKASPSRPLAIVIVTYNSAEVLPGVLDSLQAGLRGIDNAKTYVVDNASRDNSVELANAHPAQPIVLRTGRNGGYAAAINAATRQVGSDADILVLNPDVRLMPGSVRHLLARLDDPAVGVAVPHMLEENGRRAYSIRREPSLTTAWAEALLGGGLSTRLGLGEVVGASSVYERGGRIEWATGAAVAVAARARQAVGLWDETFFLYSEEVDFLRRVREAGLGVDFVANAFVVHHGGDYQERPRLYGILTANRIRYFRRYNGALSSAVFRLGIVVGEALRAARSTVHRAGLRSALSRWQQPHESLTPGPAAPNGGNDA